MPEQNQTTPAAAPSTEITPDLIQKVTDKVWALLKADLKLANDRKRFFAQSKSRFKGIR